MNNKPVVLLILDGWGFSENPDHNAISLAKTPNWDNLWKSSPHTLLSCSGADVGLPDNQMGNSEVGHLTMGAGRVIDQDLTRINKAISSGEFSNNPTLSKAFKSAAAQQKAIHLLTLVSDGGVHSHINHLLATLETAKTYLCSKVYVHAFLDGRDTPPKSAEASLNKIISWFEKNPIGQISSICGRFYAMDRDKRYERTQAAYELITDGKASFSAKSPIEALYQAYDRGESDEFVQPTIIQPNENAAVSIMESQDVVAFLNFRSDRARQLSYALTEQNFIGFNRSRNIKFGTFLTLTRYADNIKAQVVFDQIQHKNLLCDVLAKHKISQLRLAETEKYAHVTFFFNGGNETPSALEERLLIPSKKVRTYDLKPEMSADEITTALTNAINQQRHDVIICNFANADMVGHTGNLDATVKAIETLDVCIGQILQAIDSQHAQLLITSDHGNAEHMLNPETNGPHTAHTTNPVPLVYYGNKTAQFKNAGTLADIAPTLLSLLDISKPREMTGNNLLSETP